MASKAQTKGNQETAHKEDEKQTAQKNGAEAKADNSSDNDLSEKLNELRSTLSGDLSDLETEAAVELVTEWQGILQKVKEPEVKEIASHLKELAKLLKSNKATGHEISEVLIEIGEQTANYAADAEKDVKTPVRQLGKQLSKVGSTVGKIEEHEQIEEIDGLIDTLDGDLTQVENETSIGAIDTWYNVLHKSEDENIKEIANGLKELKQVLKRSKPKAADIAEVLDRLGEQTQQAAHEAKRGFKGPVQRLGKLLSKTAKSLEE
jgi:ABC-type transporter Mla subunit MlaD